MFAARFDAHFQGSKPANLVSEILAVVADCPCPQDCQQKISRILHGVCKSHRIKIYHELVQQLPATIAQLLRHDIFAMLAIPGDHQYHSFNGAPASFTWPVKDHLANSFRVNHLVFLEMLPPEHMAAAGTAWLVHLPPLKEAVQWLVPTPKLQHWCPHLPQEYQDFLNELYPGMF